MTGSFLVVSGILVWGWVAMGQMTNWERRGCGHGLAIWERWVPMATHCCSSGALVNDLRKFDGAQELFKFKYGRAARSVAELNRDPTTRVTIMAPFEFESDGTNWLVQVAKNGMLAGNYLLDSSGGIYFHETRTATTNDFVLR